MNKITSIDMTRYVLDIHRDLSVSERGLKPGPPKRIDGMTIGLVDLTNNTPARHGGEVHPDGDEILLVVKGRIRVTGESQPDVPLEIGAGEACIVRKGEWHRLSAVESPAQLVHITPGPHGDYRPL
jgi:mannose-6-phosphate isomerase-like protein (cupin superfamily)